MAKKYNELLTTPYLTKIRNFTAIAKYFQYYAPCVDSAQSSGTFDDAKSDEVLKAMIRATALENKVWFQQRIYPASWKKTGLDTDELDFEDSKLLCQKYKQESKLHALLRHIRNSMAHGYLYVWKKRNGSYIFFIDFDGEHKPTAKIMISMTILEKWKEKLEHEEV